MIFAEKLITMKIFTLLFVFLLMASTSIAQDNKSHVILNKLSSSMKTLKTFYVEFNANIKNARRETFLDLVQTSSGRHRSGDGNNAVILLCSVDQRLGKDRGVAGNICCGLLLGGDKTVVLRLSIGSCLPRVSRLKQRP